MKYEITTYPNYDEYKLIDLYPVEKIHFRRGNEFNNYFEEDFQMWQDYFCEEYVPPEGTEILLFHCCSWSKPYDFSYIINPIRDLVKKYNKVHRAILSNVGVVPYEYQMNPTFCSYDFPPAYDTTDLELNEISALRTKMLKVNYDRIYRYLKKHRNHYKKVITYSAPVQYSIAHIVGLVCKDLNIPFENAIDRTLYDKFKNKKYEDGCELLIESEILKRLDSVLDSSCKNID